MKFIAHYDEQAAAMCLAARCFQRRSTDEAAVLQLSQRKKLPFFFFPPPHKIIQAFFLLNNSFVAFNKNGGNLLSYRPSEVPNDTLLTALGSHSPLCWLPHITWAVPIPPHPQQSWSCVSSTGRKWGSRRGHRRVILFKKCPVLLFSSLVTSAGAGAFCPSQSKGIVVLANIPVLMQLYHSRRTLLALFALSQEPG